MAVAPAHPSSLLVRTRVAYGQSRVVLADGARTTAYVAVYSLQTTLPRVIVLPEPQSLATWCGACGIGEAIVGGFFTRSDGTPLGEVWEAGTRVESVPFTDPWNRLRSCLQVENGIVTVGPRAELPGVPSGDLLQAGPLLARHGRVLIADGSDLEGFSAGSAQFDSDITFGRYPRAALGLGRGLVWAVACDGRSEHDAGMTLAELAAFIVALGARSAINLDGGGSTSLICGGRLVNHPREEHGLDIPAGRPVTTAIAFLPRV